MRLLLIRHGETVDNVAGNFAGVTDSALTTHGVLQAERLATHIATCFPAVRAIFASDLQRAYRTAGAIRAAQQRHHQHRGQMASEQWLRQQRVQPIRRPAANIVVNWNNAPPLPATPPPVTATPLLRERDFGPLEGASCRQRHVHPDKVAETSGSMRRRAERFLDEMLLAPGWALALAADDVVVVVAHGLLLPYVFASLVQRVAYGKLTFDHAVLANPGAPPLQPVWSNTAYLECVVTPTSGPVPGSVALRMHVLHVNCTAHLVSLRRTRGGIGSAPYDGRQKKMEDYFARKGY